MKYTVQQNHRAVRGGAVVIAAAALVLVGCGDPVTTMTSGGTETASPTDTTSTPQETESTGSGRQTTGTEGATASTKPTVPGLERKKVDMDASVILKATIESTKSARSVQMNTTRMSYDTSSDMMFEIDVQKTFAGSRDYQLETKHQILGDIEVLEVGGVTYLKGGAAYWVAMGHAPKSGLSRLQDKWVTGPAMPETGDVVDVFSLFDGKGVSHSALSAKYTEVWQEDLDGVSLYSLEDPHDPLGPRLSVKRDEGHQLVAITGAVEEFPALAALDKPVSVMFFDWNAVEPLAPPPAAEVATLS